MEALGAWALVGKHTTQLWLGRFIHPQEILKGLKLYFVPMAPGPYLLKPLATAGTISDELLEYIAAADLRATRSWQSSTGVDINAEWPPTFVAFSRNWEVVLENRRSGLGHPASVSRTRENPPAIRSPNRDRSPRDHLQTSGDSGVGPQPCRTCAHVVRPTCPDFPSRPSRHPHLRIWLIAPRRLANLTRAWAVGPCSRLCGVARPRVQVRSE
ncbi:hypothetical protein F4780DRAFT_663297 [Xylariomycetidae sp. FL0641]|nr:hypothetical protein F4780DRAFT_663297 [Xylariomycetidae sp. FL0641]